MLSGPPRNQAGEVLPHDHEGIHDEDGVIRRISTLWVVSDPKTGQRVSTMAFEPSSGPNGGLSVDLQCEIVGAGKDAREYVMVPPWIGAIRFQAGQLRSEELKVGYDPLPNQPFHGEAWGSFTRSKKKRLLTVGQWLVEIDGVCLG